VCVCVCVCMQLNTHTHQVLAFFSCVTHLNERLIIWVIVFSGENHLIIHEGVGPFTPIRILPFQSKKCFSQFKTIYCFMGMFRQDDFQIF